MIVLVLFLLTNPSLINRYLRLVMEKANVYQVPLILDILSTIELWFRYLVDNGLTMPDDFDHEFLCEAFDVIFDTEYHSIVQKTLTILYNFAPFFGDKGRLEIFNRIFQKHFFTLFLNWEVAIRNSFQQILVFRAIKTKRTIMSSKGFILSEFASISPSGKKVEEEEEEEVSEETLMTDAHLFAKIETYKTMVEDQARDPELTYYPKRHQVYAPQALMEYRTYLVFYYQWLEKREKEVPKLLPHTIVRDRIQK